MKLSPFLSSSSARLRQGCHAYTFTEAMFSMLISTMALGALVTVLITVGKTEQSHLADASLQLETGIVQDRVTDLLRSMNATETVVAVTPVTGSAGLYRRILFAPDPIVPRRSLWYVPADKKLYYSTNFTLTAATTTLFQTQDNVLLRDMYFSLPMKNDGSTENSMVNIVMQFDDNGYGARMKGGSYTNTTVIRSFSIKLRNG